MPTKDELTTELQRLARELGKCPSFLEARGLSRFSTHQFIKEFGSWNGAVISLGAPFFIPPAWSVTQLSPYEGGWLAGLIDGEGCFRITAPSPKGGRGKSRSFSCGLKLNLRDDDIQMLEKVIRLWDISSLPHLYSLERLRNKGQKVGDEAQIDIRDMPTLWFKVIPTLQLYPLQSRKRGELAIFCIAVRIMYEKACRGQKNLPYLPAERDLISRCRTALKEAKIWKADFHFIIEKYDLGRFIQ